jgi:5-methylcytosine-specific restriction endonuclease McrA
MDESVREYVRQRAGGRCEYCLLPEEADEWSFNLEHIIAKQHGGEEVESNLCWACSRCNLFKGPNIASKDRAAGELVPLYNPRLDAWRDHFDVREALIVGRTSVGRATASLLQMNDNRRVELRRDLISRGVFQA